MLKVLDKKLARSDIADELQGIVDALVISTKPQRIFLFGSFAVDKATTASDIDLLVTFDSEDQRRLAPKAFYKYPLQRNRPLDVIWTTEAEYERRARIGGVHQIVSEDGELLYQRSEIS